MAFEDLYQEIIMDHYRNPRNRASLDHIPEEKVHENPTCGDSVKLDVSVSKEGIVRTVRFDGKGCAISTASASIMTELVQGMHTDEVRDILNTFINTMRGERSPDALDEWGDLACLKGVIQYPVRVKCATLAWHALRDSINDKKP